MSLSLKEWQDEASYLSSHKRADLIKSIKVLNSWQTFKKEYEWVGLGTLQLILEIENEAVEAAVEQYDGLRTGVAAALYKLEGMIREVK